MGAAAPFTGWRGLESAVGVNVNWLRPSRERQAPSVHSLSRWDIWAMFTRGRCLLDMAEREIFKRSVQIRL